MKNKDEMITAAETEKIEAVETEEGAESENGVGFWSKASGLGKKAADAFQRGVTVVSDRRKEEEYAQRMRKYNPLLAEDYDGYRIAEIIQIIDDSELQKIDVCVGAIGWRELSNGVEILHLSEAFVESSGLVFSPAPKRNEVYCVDAFNKESYISVESIFKRAHDERLAELERIAYMLGAKTCAIEIVESTKTADTSKFGIKFGKSNIDAKSESGGSNMRSGRTTTTFVGSDEPRLPELKWFSLDESIKSLIEMRMSDKNSVKSRKLVLEGATSATMSRSVACALDGILKNGKLGGSMEHRAVEEHSSKLIFEIEF